MTVGEKALCPSDQPVQLEGHENPKNWSLLKKCKHQDSLAIIHPTLKVSAQTGICTWILVLMTSTIAFCSSIYTAAITSIAEEYGCSSTVATLGITTFLLGFASGPLIFAPLSEVWYVPN